MNNENATEAESVAIGAGAARRAAAWPGDLDESRLALWAKWEQVNFGLYKLRKLRRTELETGAELLERQLLEQMKTVEQELGLPPCPARPFTQGGLY